MSSSQLNKMLVEHLPQLKQKYIDEVSWQEGDETGSHTVFGDVLTPYLVECILHNKKDELDKISSFLEAMLSLNDDYADEVIALSVLESIAYLFKDDLDLAEFLGNRARVILNDFLPPSNN